MEFESFREAPDGLDRGTDGAPVPRLGVLVENPTAFEDLAGVDLPQAELLQETRTVLCGFHGLAAEVNLLIQLHLVRGPTGLEGGTGGRVGKNRDGM